MDGRQFLFQLFHCSPCTASDNYYSIQTLLYHVTWFVYRSGCGMEKMFISTLIINFQLAQLQ